MRSCTRHRNVIVTWLEQDAQRCPLCAALDGAGAGEEEMRARLAWMTAEREAWRERAVRAELEPGRPYRMEDRPMGHREVMYWSEIKAADGRAPILVTRHSARELLDAIQEAAAKLAEESVDYDVDVWRDERWVENGS